MENWHHFHVTLNARSWVCFSQQAFPSLHDLHETDLACHFSVTRDPIRYRKSRVLHSWTLCDRCHASPGETAGSRELRSGMCSMHVLHFKTFDSDRSKNLPTKVSEPSQPIMWQLWHESPYILLRETNLRLYSWSKRLPKWKAQHFSWFRAEQLNQSLPFSTMSSAKTRRSSSTTQQNAARKRSLPVPPGGEDSSVAVAVRVRPFLTR